MINLELPDLPYSKDALMPYMSAETLELHHDKHHMAYITNGNKFIKEQNISEDYVNDTVINSYQKNAPVFNNVAQHINHVHFWEVMKNNPDCKIPSELESKIVSDIGSVEKMKEDYIKIGQSATTLSGGEEQRIKLSKELSKRSTGKTLYILDEPTTGLHFDDVKKLLKILHTLVDEGNTVIVIEHNLDVIKTADHIIDLGPLGGVNGGQIVGTGTPEDIANNKKSFTGEFLKKIL